jgi:pimeloyl-ACP methyl ester carboxylesterase
LFDERWEYCVDRAITVSVGQVNLFVRELGPDETANPPLLVIHGGPDWDHSYLLPGLVSVADHRRVVLFDMRGCGRSSRGLPSGEYQPEFVVQDIVELVALLGYDRVDLLGFSTGGQVAQLVTEVHPALVRRLVLASTTAYPDFAHHLKGWSEYRRRSTLTTPTPEWATFTDGGDLDDLVATIRWALEAAPTAIWNLQRMDEYLALLGRIRFSGDWLGPFRRGALHPWRPKDPERVLRDFGEPILILHGAQDMSFPVQVAQRLHGAVPRSQLEVIEQAGHMTHFDQPEAWSTTVIDFLAG